MIIARHNGPTFIWKAPLYGEILGFEVFLEKIVRLRVSYIYLLSGAGISPLLLYSGSAHSSYCNL